MRELTDGACTKTDYHIGLVVGEALEVAPQRSFFGGDGKRIIRQRVMVETDRLIPRRNEQPMAELCLIELLLGIRQSAAINLPLTRNEVRDVGISEQRDPFWSKPDRFDQGSLQLLRALVRQAVHQVEIE